MEFGKKKVGKVGTSKFLNILLPGFTIVHKYVGAVFQDHCLICNFIPKILMSKHSMGAGTPTPRTSAS